MFTNNEQNSQLMHGYFKILNKIIDIRKQCLTIRKAAKQLHISPANLHGLENKKKIDFELLERYAAMFGIEIYMFDHKITQSELRKQHLEYN